MCAVSCSDAPRAYGIAPGSLIGEGSQSERKGARISRRNKSDWQGVQIGDSYPSFFKGNSCPDRSAPQLEHSLSYHASESLHSGHCQRSCSYLAQSLIPIFWRLRRLSGSSAWCSLPSLLKSVKTEHGKSEQSEQRATSGLSAAHRRISHFSQ